MKSKFEPDVDSSVRPPARLIDPEAYDASEQSFAASIEEKTAPARFVADAVQGLSCESGIGQDSFQAGESRLAALNSDPKEISELDVQSTSLQADLMGAQDAGSWRHEVAARVNNYRARRRPRAPRYPSLQLKFDPPGPSWTDHAGTIEPATSATATRLAVAMQDSLAPPQDEQSIRGANDGAEQGVGAGARILEFPRGAVAPPVFDGLAEPVAGAPRILEVPDLLLPPPALGGILMEPVEEPAKERRPGFELPLQAAPMSRRVLASAIDALLVISAFAVFAYIFSRVTAIMPPWQQTAELSAILAALFWTCYQYLLLVYTGTTPGLKLAHLQLSRFDGSVVPRRTRRWRVVASVLSGLSLAMGYAWCFLDEDRLCWHDRITRTYMAPNTHPVGPLNRAGMRRSSS